MESKETDEEIIGSYRKGDREAFKKLIDSYTSPLYNFTARISNKNDAPDIVQEVFIKVWKNLPRFDHTKASFKTWIFTITRNTVTDFLRKKKSLLFSDLEKDSEEDTSSFAENIPDDSLLPDETLHKLQEKKANKEFLNNLLEKINPKYQEILVLHYQEELTFDEIGKILNKPLNTVKSQHRRAIIELQKQLS
jgi:RNA polymerase sigma factor (sigma-70 family)